MHWIDFAGCSLKRRTRNRPEVLVDSSLQQYKVVVVMEDGLMEL